MQFDTAGVRKLCLGKMELIRGVDGVPVKPPRLGRAMGNRRRRDQVVEIDYLFLGNLSRRLEALTKELELSWIGNWREYDEKA